MSTLSYLLCLLLGIALPVGVIYFAARRAWRQLAVADAYRVVARGLGLSVDTRGVSVHGHLDGRRLYVGEVLEGHGTDRHIEHRGIIGLSRPLGLGLLIRPRTSRRWRRRARAERVQTTDSDFDRLFEVFGDDEERINVLLDDRLLAAVTAFAHRWPDLMITDHHVRVILKRPQASPADLGALVDGMRRLADLLVERRRAVRPPKALEGLVPAWEALGEALGLEVEPWLPALVGTLDERRVQAQVRRETDGFHTEIVVTTREHRDLGLRLQPQTQPDGYWSVGQDIQVDDPAFDRGFVIKVYDPNAVRRLLGEEARALLLDLVADGVVIDMDDLRLRLRHAPLDPADVERVLRASVAAVEATGW